MKEYNKPFLEDEDILIEDIMVSSGDTLAVSNDPLGPTYTNDPGESFSNGGN